MAKPTYDEASSARSSTRRLHQPSIGPTNFGITIHDCREHVKRDATTADICNELMWINSELSFCRTFNSGPPAIQDGGYQ